MQPVYELGDGDSQEAGFCVLRGARATGRGGRASGSTMNLTHVDGGARTKKAAEAGHLGRFSTLFKKNIEGVPGRKLMGKGDPLSHVREGYGMGIWVNG